MHHSFFMLLQLGTGLFWIITYILIIKKGFQDRTYGMPMAAICANISWEFIFSLIYPHKSPQNIINIVWFVLDVIIMIQYLIYGKKEIKKITRKFFYSYFLIALSVSFIIIIAITKELNDFEGKYAAFAQNLMMSALFISLLTRRGSLAGQSIHIAVFKMFGSLFAAIAFFVYLRSSNLIIIISVATFIYDCIYIYFVNKMSSKRLC